MGFESQVMQSIAAPPMRVTFAVLVGEDGGMASELDPETPAIELGSVVEYLGTRLGMMDGEFSVKRFVRIIEMEIGLQQQSLNFLMVHLLCLILERCGMLVDSDTVVVSRSLVSARV